MKEKKLWLDYTDYKAEVNFKIKREREIFPPHLWLLLGIEPKDNKAK